MPINILHQLVIGMITKKRRLRFGEKRKYVHLVLIRVMFQVEKINC